MLDRRRQNSRETHDQLAGRLAANVGQDFAIGTLRAEILAHAWPVRPGASPTSAVVRVSWPAGSPNAATDVIGVDHSERMLDARRSMLLRNGRRVPTAVNSTPCRSADGEVDAAFANLVWHHVPDLDAAAREVCRVVRPGGHVVVSDLLPHDSDWMRERMGDLRLGLKPDQVIASLLRAGCQELVGADLADRYRVVAPDGATAEFSMFVVRGRKPAATP